MRLQKPSLGSAVVVGALALGLSSAARASMYGNFPAETVTYQNVTENDSQISGPPTVTSTPTGLFGTPLVSPSNSNTLTFPDNTFDALAADGSFDFQDGKLTFDIVPNNPDASIGSLSFDESGGWKLEGPAGDASDEATLLFSSVEITAVNGIPILPIIVVNPIFNSDATASNGTATVTHANGDLTLVSDGSNAVGTWHIDATFNLAAALAEHDMTGDITEVSVALDDQLTANTTSAASVLTLASIDKKDIDITVGSTPTPPVPEPETIIWAVCCAGLMMRFPRGRNRSGGAKAAI